MNSSQTQEEKIFNKISQVLLEKKGLQTIIPQGSKGGFGLVLFVQDIKTKLKYAVKAQSIVDQTNGGIDDDKLEMCKAESEILKNIQHKNIVEYHSDYSIDLYHFIQMNLCECSLDDWIQKRGNKPLSYGMFLHILNQILDGIEHLHKLKYVLRDVSAKNILISSDGTIKLCDFGLAKKIEAQIMASKIQSNNVKGVFAYYPPELIKELENDSITFTQSQRGDIWALGICLSLLGGLKFHQVAQFNQPDAQIKHSPLLDSFCNQIIQFILKENPKERPTISSIRKFIFDKLSQNKEEQQIDLYSKVYYNQEETYKSYNQRDFEINIENWKEVEQKCLQNTQNIESLIQLSQINLYCYNDVNKAQENLRDALLLNQNDSDVYLQMSQILIFQQFQEGKKNEKISQFINKASQIQPNNWRLYYMKFQQLLFEGNFKQAGEELQNAIQKKGKYPLLIGNQYILQFIQSQDKDEKNLILKKFENDLNQYRVNLGFLYHHCLEFEKSLKYYQLQLDYLPKDITCLNSAGLCYQNLQKYDLAIEHFQKAIDINPNYESAKKNLLKLTEMMNRKNE